MFSRKIVWNILDTAASDAERVETVSSEDLPLLGHSGPVYTTCFTPDGSGLLSASEDTTGRGLA
jgi:WD40 repeat protein